MILKVFIAIFFAFCYKKSFLLVNLKQGGLMAKTLFKSVMLVAAFSVATRVLGFLFRIYLSRQLGAELLGIYQIASSVFMVLVLLVASGIPSTVSKETARCFVQKNNKKAHSITTSALIIAVFISVLIFLVFIIFKDIIAKIFADEFCMEVLMLLIPAVIFSAIYSSLRGYLWGRQDYFFMGLGEFVEQLSRILIFMLFIKVFFPTLNGAKIAALSLTIACFISMCFIIVVFYKKGGRLKSPKGCLKPVISSSAPITGVRTASSLIQPIIALIFPALLVFSGTEQNVAVSLYGVLMGMTFPLLFLPSTLIGSLSFVLIPEISKQQEESNTSLVEERIRSGLLFSILISLFIVPLYIGLGVPICEFLFNNSLSGEFLKWASIIMLPMGLSNISSSMLNSLNLEVKSFVNNILGGIVLVLCVVLFTNILGAYALILGFCLCMLITSLCNILMIKKHMKIKLKIFKPMIVSVFLCVPIALLTSYFYGLCAIIFPQFVAIMLSGFIGALFYVLLLKVFKICEFTFVFSKLKNVMKFSQKRA